MIIDATWLTRLHDSSHWSLLAGGNDMLGISTTEMCFLIVLIMF